MVNPFFKQLTKGSKVKVDPTELLKKKFGKLVKEDELPLEAPVTPVTKKEVVKEPPTIKPETETAFEMDTVKAAGVTEEDILKFRKPKSEGGRGTSEEFRKALKGRNPELQELANKVKEGKIPVQEYRSRADEIRPIRLVSEVPKPATNKEIVSALNSKQRQNPIIGLNGTIPEKDIVEVRLNIPAYTDYDVWIPTIRHNGKEKYKAAVRIKNVEFIQPDSSGSRKALRIAQGGEKNPFAVMKGEYVDGSDDELFNMAKEAFDSRIWTQVGYDPIKRGFFYARETGEPILSAEEVIQVGHLVLAKKAVKGNADDFDFNQGGLAVSDLEEFASKLIAPKGISLILDENVGEDTGEVTKIGRPKKRTPKGETVSEKSTTIEIDGKHYNLPTIYGNKRYSDFVLKRALIEGIIKETSVHDSREEAEEAAEKRSKGLNQGGTAMKDQMQMAFMNEGGMKDDGGETEPTSGNKVPSGSLKEEVADDIPAMLSEGEFVFPADVVRYIGLETLMKMRQDAKQGLKMMEKMGQLGNPEEAELPDDIPFGRADLVVVSGEMKDKEKKAEGGVVGLANGGSLFDDPRFQTATTRQPDPTVYTPEEEGDIKGALDEPLQPTDIQIKKIINPSNPDDFMMWSFDKEGNPLYPLPEGYVVDDTPVEDSYSNIISRREQPTESDSGDSGRMVDPRDSAGMTLPKADEFIDSDQYIDADGKKEYGLFSRGRPIRLQKTTLDNLTMEYNKLKQIQPNLTFEQYYNLPTYDKVRFSLRSSLGRDPDRKEIDAAIRQAQQSPTGLISFLNPVVGAIKSFLSPDASGGFTDKEYKEQRDKRDEAVRKLTNLADPRTKSPYKTDEEGKISDAEYQKYKADIALESQAKFPSTGKVGKVDDFLLGIRRDPNKPNEPPKIMTPQGVQDLTADALGRIEKNRQEQQNINQRLDAADRDRQERGFGPMSVQEREEKRQEEFTGFDSSGNFIGPTDPGTAAMNRFYVGGVPTKPMKPQRLKKGGIASPKAKPKRMKKGGLASSRKK